MATSKNNPEKRNASNKGHFVISDDCEKCAMKCDRGIAYLGRYAIKHEGNGVWCQK